MVKTRKKAAIEHSTSSPRHSNENAELLKVLTSLVSTLVEQSAPKESTVSTPVPPPVSLSQTVPPQRPLQQLIIPKLTSPDNMSIPQFRDWKQRWTDYSKAQQLQNVSTDTQHGILRSALDQEWTMLWNSGRLSIKDDTSVTEILKFMEEYLRRRRNPLLDRQEFIKRDQMSGESADRYFAALNTLDDACAHDNPSIPFSIQNQLQEIRIRDRLICGLQFAGQRGTTSDTCRKF